MLSYDHHKRQLIAREAQEVLFKKFSSPNTKDYGETHGTQHIQPV